MTTERKDGGPAQSISTMPSDGEFLAFNGPRKRWMQVFRYELVGSLNQHVVEPYSGLMFVPKAWAPLPVMLSERQKGGA
jgi:hypothetical protein